MNLQIFVEGPTEKRLVRELLKGISADIATENLPVNSVGGKRRLWPDVESSLKPAIGSGQHQGILIFRDRDEDDKSISNILSEFEEGLQNLLGVLAADPVSFQRTTSYTNLFSYELPIPDQVDIVLILHIPEQPELSVPIEDYPFKNATTDHAILAASLTSGVSQQFARDAGIPEAVLIKKVTEEIPHLLKENGIVDIGVKDFISGYMTASRFLHKKGSERRETFAETVVGRIKKYAPDEYQKIFASHLVAIEMLVNRSRYLDNP